MYVGGKDLGGTAVGGITINPTLGGIILAEMVHSVTLERWVVIDGSFNVNRQPGGFALATNRQATFLLNVLPVAVEQPQAKRTNTEEKTLV